MRRGADFMKRRYREGPSVADVIVNGTLQRAMPRNKMLQASKEMIAHILGAASANNTRGGCIVILSQFTLPALCQANII